MSDMRLNEGASLYIRSPEGFPPEIQARAREIVQLYTEPDRRGQGYARKLMEEVIKEADAAGMGLLLHCKAEDGQTVSERLQSFYAGLGFMVFQRDPLLMCRPVNASGTTRN